VVRRALELLASEELVDIRPNRGAAVAKPTPGEARDLFSVRQDRQQRGGKRVCGRLTPEQVARLEAQIAAEERAIYEGRAEYIRLAAEFHVILAEMSGSALLARYMRQIVGRSALVLGLYGRPQWSNCSVHEHRDLLAALVSGDLDLSGYRYASVNPHTQGRCRQCARRGFRCRLRVCVGRSGPVGKAGEGWSGRWSNPGGLQTSNPGENTPPFRFLFPAPQILHGNLPPAPLPKNT